MSKAKIKGLSAFELLDGLDDGMIEAAALPETVTVAMAPAKGERVAAFFSRMGRSGLAAALISVAVALAVLVGIVAAGRMGMGNPSDTDPSQGIHGNQPHESGYPSDTNHGLIAPPLTGNPEQETYPNDVGETPEPPRVTVGTGFGSLHFGNTSHSREYHEGYMLWMEQWDDGGMISADGLGARGQLTDIYADLPWIRHYMGETPTVRVVESSDTLTCVSVYDKLAQHFGDGADTAVLSTLEEGVYVVILVVVIQGAYIDEAEAYERTCTEYAFILEVVEEQAGIPGVPETNPRVVVSGGGQTAVFETEEDGVLMWTEKAGQGRKTVTVPNWFGLADPQTIDRLPRMSLKPGDELTLTLDAAGDSLIGVTVYGLKDTVAQGEDLSVISPTLFDKWLDEGVVFAGRVVLQVTSRTGEDEISCYEYVILIEVAP